MKNYDAFCAQQTQALFEIIDQHGSLLAWQKEWQVQAAVSLPLSVHGHYRGGNLISLLMAQLKHGWTSPHWLTFRQVQQCGGHVLKGAKGAAVCFWKLLEVEKEAEADKIPLFKTYNVFNLDQTSLNESALEALPQPPQADFAEWLKQQSVAVSHFGNQPYYNAAEDVIVLPQPQYFDSEANYYVTFLHELVHWTGHASRLNRASLANYRELASRAEEELVAEIGSVLLATHFGLRGQLVNHAAYVASWKQCLNEKAVARAISQAGKAFHWLINGPAD